MLPMPIVCLGLSHHTAPLEVREQLSYSVPDLDALRDVGVKSHSIQSTIRELGLISTCNRFELYAAVQRNPTAAREVLMAQLSRASGMTVSGLEAYVYFLEGSEAVDHLLRVSAGLESLVLGEPQILGQVTESFMSGSNGEAFGPQLTALFRIAIRAGKRARSETAISSRPASIPSVAIAKAQEIAGDLRLRNPLVVGMGEMGRLALKSLQSRGVRRISVANRNREVAESFAEGCKGSAYGMAELARGLAESDVVISATAAPHIVIRPELVKQAMARRGNRPLVLVDIAVPRDIDPGVADIPGVHLFDMDDLNGSLDEALAARRQEVPKVEAILSEERAAFEEDLRQISVRPLIAGLYQKAEFIRQQELKRTLRSLDGIDLRTAEQIQLFSRSLVNKLLHHPTVRLKEVASNGEADVYADTVRHLFALEAEGVIDDA